MPVSQKPTMSKRAAPNQKRSQATHDRVLQAAADLLEEVGFEALSTNLICRRAGLTPPALYRYFPNKYAVLAELGERLMARQNALMSNIRIDTHAPEKLSHQIAQLLEATIAVTRETPAGGWILRSLHASPVLADIRLASHRDVARQLRDTLCAQWPGLSSERAFQTLRLNVELGYAAVEMVFDEPSLDTAPLIRMTADMLAHNLLTLLKDEI